MRVQTTDKLFKCVMLIVLYKGYFNEKYFFYTNDLTYITTMVIDFPETGKFGHMKKVSKMMVVCLYKMIYYMENTEKIRKHSGDSVYKIFTFRKYFFLKFMRKTLILLEPMTRIELVTY